jgi:hypothetical protein
VKFYFCDKGRNPEHPDLYKQAHIAVYTHNQSRAKALCRTFIEPKNWVLVDKLPEDTDLCRSCQALAQQLLLTPYVSPSFTRRWG